MKIRRWLFGTIALIAAAWAFLYIFAGGYLLHRLLHRPGWPEMAPTDFRVSHAMRAAWQDTPPIVHPGVFAWTTLSPGLDVAELPVLTANEEIDRIYLVRLDPARYRFSVHTKPRKPYWIDGWEKALPDAAVIVNGSYFAKKTSPTRRSSAKDSRWDQKPTTPRPVRSLPMPMAPPSSI